MFFYFKSDKNYVRIKHYVFYFCMWYNKRVRRIFYLNVEKGSVYLIVGPKKQVQILVAIFFFIICFCIVDKEKGKKREEEYRSKCIFMTRTYLCIGSHHSHVLVPIRYPLTYQNTDQLYPLVSHFGQK